MTLWPIGATIVLGALLRLPLAFILLSAAMAELAIDAILAALPG